ncbi:hypothetical protein Aca07nite_85540 [Actinoplanes capillaceus]|uniref:Uncharacterized protein n=1 Tax=Actinoplanes campanulatus TaxID=113559 RepID=A0ABQ3WYC0_9ACTN|nr:hypothetical protein Aca07nite_85540 [Actinoplanes capillaceus]
MTSASFADFNGADPHPVPVASTSPVAAAALIDMPILSLPKPVGPSTGVVGLREVFDGFGDADDGVTLGETTGTAVVAEGGAGVAAPAGEAWPSNRCGEPAQPAAAATPAAVARTRIVRRISVNLSLCSS